MNRSRSLSRWLVVPTITAMATVAVAGCSTVAGPSASEPEAVPIVQVILPNPSPAMSALQAGLEARGEELGLDVQVSQTNLDLTKDISNVNDAIAKGAAAIVILPLSAEGVIPALTRASSDGICVLPGGTNRTPNNPLVPDASTYWLWDDTVAGTNLALQVAEEMGGTGGVFYLAGTATDPGSQARGAALEAVIEKDYPGIEFLGSEPGDYDAATARTVMQNAIQRYGEKITAVVAGADNMAEAATDVLASSALAGTVTVGSFGGQATFVEYIKDGRAFGTVPYPYTDIGASVMDAAKACIEGEDVPAILDPRTLDVLEPLQTSGYVITRDNADEYAPQY